MPPRRRRNGKLDYYFYWKTDDQAGGVPKWEDMGVESKVREAWKLVQAREPAMKAAEDLKKKAIAAEKDDKSKNEGQLAEETRGRRKGDRSR